MLHPIVLFLDDGPWRIAAYDGDEPGLTLAESTPEASVEQRITELCETLHRQGLADAPILLAVPSTWCAAASIQTGDLPRKDRQIAMAYRLEEKLPIAAEQFSAGFILGGGEALGVCVILEKIKPIAEGLESRGILIHAIIPTVMLAAQQLVLEHPGIDANVFIWRHDGWLDMVTLGETGQKPASWSLLPDEPDAVALHLNLLAIQGRVVRGLMMMSDRGAPGERSGDLPVNNTTLVDEDPYQLAARYAGRLLAGQSEPWVDLKGSALGADGRARLLRRPLKAAMVAALLMLVCLNAAFLLRAQHYQALSDRDREQERSLYTGLFPGQTPPIAIHTRLEREYKKISGMRGNSESLPPPPVTLSLLYRVLDQLPDDVRCRVIELRIEDDSVYIDGQARSHGDVGLIAQALAAGDALTVETRHTEQLHGEQGVGFVIVASPKPVTAKPTMKGVGP